MCIRESGPTSSSPGIRDFFVDLIFTALGFLSFNSREDVLLEEDALCYQLNRQWTQEVWGGGGTGILRDQLNHWTSDMEDLRF